MKSSSHLLCAYGLPSQHMLPFPAPFSLFTVSSCPPPLEVCREGPSLTSAQNTSTGIFFTSSFSFYLLQPWAGNHKRITPRDPERNRQILILIPCPPRDRSAFLLNLGVQPIRAAKPDDRGLVSRTGWRIGFAFFSETCVLSGQFYRATPVALS